jgi:hypothetical protein
VNATSANGHHATNGTGHEDRLPPHNLDAEREVLSACVIDNAVIDRVRRVVRPESFWRSNHGLIFKAILGLADAGRPVDGITLAESLKIEFARPGADESDLSADYLAEVIGAAPHAVNAEHHAAIVAELAGRRRLIQLLHDATRRAYGNADPADVLARDIFVGFVGAQEGESPDFDGLPRKIVAQLRPVPGFAMQPGIRRGGGPGRDGRRDRSQGRHPAEAGRRLDGRREPLGHDRRPARRAEDPGGRGGDRSAQAAGGRGHRAVRAGDPATRGREVDRRGPA